MTRKLQVFLCHAKEDKPAVRELYKRLKFEQWIEPWLDEENLLGGQKWDTEIQQTVHQSDVVLVFLSNNSITKEGYVQKEITFALDVANEKPEEIIYIIPARLEDCKVPSRLNKLQWIDLFDTNGFDKLKKSLVARAEGLGINCKDLGILEGEAKSLADYVAVLQEQDKKDGWKSSPFEWITNLPSHQKGRVGKILVEKWLSKKGVPHEESRQTEFDLSINGKAFVVKFSTLWTSGVYKFQQIRDTQYDFIIFFGISPNEVHCWVIPKDKIMEHLNLPDENFGRLNLSISQELFWVTVNPSENDNWLSEFGGNLEKAYLVLKKYLP